MIAITMLQLWFYVLIFDYQLAEHAVKLVHSEISYNQPELSPCAQWNASGITLVSEVTHGWSPETIFIDRDNTIYAIAFNKDYIYQWNEDSVNISRRNFHNLIGPLDLFITSPDNFYFMTGYSNARITKWNPNTFDTVPIVHFCERCFDIFIAINNVLYCSMEDRHQIATKALYENSSTIDIVAGIGIEGSISNMLHYPQGIFVNSNFDLYVADRSNHRIQLFRSGEFNGTTVVGRSDTIDLTHPSSVTLDANNNIYVVDTDNRRIVVSGQYGFRCLVGCSQVYGEASDQLANPKSMAFDNYDFTPNETVIRTTKNITAVPRDTMLTSLSLRATNGPTYIDHCDESSSDFDHISMPEDSKLRIQIYVQIFTVGLYRFSIDSDDDVFGYLHKDYVNPRDLSENALFKLRGSCDLNQFQMPIYLQTNITYVLAIVTADLQMLEPLSVHVFGPNNVRLTRADTSLNITSVYSSELDTKSPMFTPTACGQLDSHFEAVEFTVTETGVYTIIGDSSVGMDAYLYEDSFNPFNLKTQLIAENHIYDVCNFQSHIVTRLVMDTKYVFVVATQFQDDEGTFSVFVFGPNNVSFNRIDNIPLVVQSKYLSELTGNSLIYSPTGCGFLNHYFEALELHVIETGDYTITSQSVGYPEGSLYENNFDVFNPKLNLIELHNEKYECYNEPQFVTRLLANNKYILVVTTLHKGLEIRFSVLVTGPKKVTFKRILVQSTYTSVLTEDTPTYPRVCGKGNYHYETIEVNVEESGTYNFGANSSLMLYGQLHKDSFNSLNPTENELTHSNRSCDGYRLFHFTAHLEINTTYILLVTTFEPNQQGEFMIVACGTKNVNLTRLVNSQSSCVIGDRCHSYTKGIGMTIDDILRNEIQQTTIFSDQSFVVKMSAIVTMVMFVGGMINGLLSLLTFRNVELRKTGCGIYLLASSVTSLFTISVFTFKFWFVLYNHINVSVNAPVFRDVCIFLEPFLKILVYLDTWLNSCVAIERAVNVYKGVQFDKKKSRRAARWIVKILPIFIVATIIHEPMHRHLFEYTNEIYGSDENRNQTNETIRYETEKYVLCVVTYPSFVQNYNTTILFLHLIVPFLANLCSTLYIIFGNARRRSTIQTKQTFQELVLKQINEHKQLIVSPLILLVLSLPRLIISLISGCIDASNNPSLYLCAYFISFTPSMLIFIVFVLPSDLYMKTFKDSLRKYRPRSHR
ncbi:unnamed protein product [Adineta ricciae]|uniref:G-protein coupled receptors family 1 profile domain-containing protein n=1 Tax=Adineta ricciae TaxID=249248 RepID=A0A815CYC9_ADIRI|nr:unnamed protein product [Adineta ricciae]